MRKIKIALAFTLLFVASLSFASVFSKPATTQGGLEYGYDAPEMFFHDTETIKFGVEYEILNCFGWDDNNRPVNQCVDMELIAINSTGAGDYYFSAPLNNEGQCLDETCQVGLELPLVLLLTPEEYESYSQGEMIVKKITLRLSFGSEEAGKDFAQTFYVLTYVLNQNGPETIEIDSFVRDSAL